MCKTCKLLLLIGLDFVGPGSGATRLVDVRIASTSFERRTSKPDKIVLLYYSSWNKAAEGNDMILFAAVVGWFVAFSD